MEAEQTVKDAQIAHVCKLCRERYKGEFSRSQTAAPMLNDTRRGAAMDVALMKFILSGRDPAAVLYSVDQANERGLAHPFQNGNPSDYDCAKWLVESQALNELERVRKSGPAIRDTK